MITIAGVLMCIGLMTVAYAFIWMLQFSFCKQEKEAKPFNYKNMDDDLPKWDKLNTVGKMANKELKKMYKGNVELYNDPRN